MPSSRTGLTPHLRFRRAVLHRDRKAGITQCPLCHATLNYEVSRLPNSGEPDHITPASTARTLGWTDAQINHPSNGRTICRRCNQSRGNKTDPAPKTRNVQASPIW